MLGLLPFVACEVHHIDQTGLGTLVASFALGSLIGSISASFAGRALRPARMMIVFALAWYACLLAFAAMPGPASGRVALIFVGMTQAPRADIGAAAAQRWRTLSRPGEWGCARRRSMVCRQVCSRTADRADRLHRDGVGLCVVGSVLTALIALRRREALWPLSAPANARPVP